MALKAKKVKKSNFGIFFLLVFIFILFNFYFSKGAPDVFSKGRLCHGTMAQWPVQACMLA